MSYSIIPAPRVALTFRVGTMADIPWMDSLQKQFGTALGFFKTQMYEGYVKLGAVLIAEMNVEGGVLNVESAQQSTINRQQSPTPVGYCISRDRYLKRDELGAVFQLCVDPKVQRGYVGAALVKEVFARSAYGCRLYCLWCAQDLKANEFWEAMGFVPIAFRSGSDKKRRVHIFWQKKIVEGDTETKWWYPFQTTGGAIRADRLVFPIPEGVHWRDVRAPVLSAVEGVEIPVNETPKLEGPAKLKVAKTPTAKSAKADGPKPMGGFRFQSEVKPKRERTAKPPFGSEPQGRRQAGPAPTGPERGRGNIDAKFLAAGRELRDRWLEHVNANPAALASSGKYDVARLLAPAAAPLLALPEAA